MWLRFARRCIVNLNTWSNSCLQNWGPVEVWMEMGIWSSRVDFNRNRLKTFSGDILVRAFTSLYPTPTHTFFSLFLFNSVSLFLFSSLLMGCGFASKLNMWHVRPASHLTPYSKKTIDCTLSLVNPVALNDRSRPSRPVSRLKSGNEKHNEQVDDREGWIGCLMGRGVVQTHHRADLVVVEGPGDLLFLGQAWMWERCLWTTFEWYSLRGVLISSVDTSK